MTETESPYMTRHEAAAFLRVGPHTVDNHARAGRLTRHKIEGTHTVLFLRTQVEMLVSPMPMPAVVIAQ